MAPSQTPIIEPAEELTPREIVRELDRYIIGQTDAKKSVAIALRNRTRRKKLDPEMQEEIAPKNIIMIGPTGVGKTEIARRLSRLVRAPFIKVEITKYTEVGYIGRDVESMIRDLTAISVNMVKGEYGLQVEVKARANADERILELLAAELPPENGFTAEEESGGDFESDKEREPDGKGAASGELEELGKRLEAGELDDRVIEYEAETAAAMPVMSVFGGAGMEDMDIQIQNMLGDLMPKRNRISRLTVREARQVFFEEETEKLIDMERVNAEAVRRVEEMGIVFIDEIDKIAGSGSGSGPDVSRQGVQRDLLPIVEGTTVITKYGSVKTNHILFIAAGAFSMSKPSDLIPELQGRFPIRVELKSLTEDDFRQILTVPRNCLTRQYTELLGTEGVGLVFTADGVDELARIAQRVNGEHENIGARRLHTLMEKLLEEISFEAPDLGPKGKHISIDSAYVLDKLGDALKDRDLSRYIL